MRSTRLAVALTACVVAFLAAEGAARVDDAIRYGTPIAWYGTMQDLVKRDTAWVRGTPYGRYRHFQLDSLGFRGPDVALEPKPGCTRVLILGASESFGFTEPPGKGYVAQLTDSLARHGCYEVVNGAIMGVTTPNVTEYWERWASKVQPDLVFYYDTPQFYLTNDPPARIARRTPDPDRGSQWWRSRFIQRLDDLFEVPLPIQAWRARKNLEQMVASSPPDWLYTSVPKDRLDLFEADLQELVASIRARGARPMLGTHGTRFHRPLTPEDQRLLSSWRLLNPRATEPVILQFEDAANDRVRELARREGIPLVDSAEEMNGHPEYFADPSHFSALGAGVMAGILAASIASANGS